MLPSIPNPHALRITWSAEGISNDQNDLYGRLLQFRKEVKNSFFSAKDLLRLREEDYGIEAAMHDLHQIKLNAIRSIGQGRLVSVAPRESFHLLFTTKDQAQNILTITFASYPAKVTIRSEDGKLCPVETMIPSGFHSSGFWIPAYPYFREGPEALTAAHRAVLDLCHQLNSHVPDFHFLDKTGFDRHGDPKRLYSTVRNRLCLDAYYAGHLLAQNSTLSRNALAEQYPVLNFPEFESMEMEGELLANEIDNS